MARHRVTLAIALALITAAPTASHADPLSPDTRVARKLGRGLSNTLFSLAEVPFHMAKVDREEGPFAGATVGFVVGMGNALIRTAAGILEVVTFPLPIPRLDYGPLLEPEFLFDHDSGWTDEWRSIGEPPVF